MPGRDKGSRKGGRRAAAFRDKWIPFGGTIFLQLISAAAAAAERGITLPYYYVLPLKCGLSASPLSSLSSLLAS